MSSIILLLTLAVAFINCIHQSQSVPSNEQKVTYLHVGIAHKQESLTKRMQMLYSEMPIHIYCRRNQELQWNNIFQNNQLRLDIKPNMEYKQYKATNAKGVLREHQNGHESQEDKLLAGETQTMHYISLPSHDHYCYGIQTDQAYNITLLQVKRDKERVACFAIGLLLWLCSTPDLLGDCLVCGYCLLFILGNHIMNLIVVLTALFYRGDYLLHYWQPVRGNFISLLKLYPTSIALVLVAQMWLLKQACRLLKNVWDYSLVRDIHYHMLRIFSYMLLLSASNHWFLGWFIVSLLLPWPEILMVLQVLGIQCRKKYRSMCPLKMRSLQGRASKSIEKDLHGVLHGLPTDPEQLLNHSNHSSAKSKSNRGQRVHFMNEQVQVDIECDNNLDVDSRAGTSGTRNSLDSNVIHRNSNRRLQQMPRSV